MVCGRGAQSILRARSRWLAWVPGPSTSPLDRMQNPLAPPRYLRSPVQASYEYKDSAAWGAFVRYLELAGDGFASRQVDEYVNGNLTRYDRVHWDDQFGTLASLRFGDAWVREWGEPITISRDDFEAKWKAAGNSPISHLKSPPPPAPPPWL